MDNVEGSTTTVLIADDDALVRGVLRMALSRVGHRIVEAQDALEAIEAAAEHDLGLVILDINMPGAGIHETLTSLRDGAVSLPVLVLSGEATPPADVVGPFTDFASKPIDLDDFLARVRRLLIASAEA